MKVRKTVVVTMASKRVRVFVPPPRVLSVIPPQGMEGGTPSPAEHLQEVFGELTRVSACPWYQQEQIIEEG